MPGLRSPAPLDTLAQRSAPLATPHPHAHHPCLMSQLELSTCTKIGRRKTQEVRRDWFARLPHGSSRLASRNQRPSPKRGAQKAPAAASGVRATHFAAIARGVAVRRRAGLSLRAGQDCRTREQGRCRMTWQSPHSVPQVEPVPQRAVDIGARPPCCMPMARASRCARLRTARCDSCALRVPPPRLRRTAWLFARNFSAARTFPFSACLTALWGTTLPPSAMTSFRASF